MLKTSMAASVLLALCPSLAHAVEVYPGCPAAPGPKPGHHTFYVDPVRGTDKGDGSVAKPWQHLDQVIGWGSKLLANKWWSNQTKTYNDANPNGPIKPGDVIMLMNGDHGNLRILDSVNSDFVWVMAAPDQHPIIHQLVLTSSAKWVFQGIVFKGEAPVQTSDIDKKPWTPQVQAGGMDWTGPSSEFIFDNNTFMTTDDTSQWKDADWVAKPYLTSFVVHAPCSSATNNTFKNVYNAAILSAPQMLFQNNKISFFTNDAIETLESNTTIRGNTITDGMNNPASGMHPDGIQGWSQTVNGVLQTNTNVRIVDNTLVKWPKTGTYMQGISIYDGLWDKLAIENNVVITDATGGITLYGGKNSTIINNTLISTGREPAVLFVNRGVGGVLPSNVIVRNNIAPVYTVICTCITFDHNVFTNWAFVIKNNQRDIFKTTDAATQSIFQPSLSSLFSSFDLASHTADLHLGKNSVAAKAGSTDNAPLTDILGRTRQTPIDIGAYARM